jgi:23S rRNA (cytosine1962-C5)-methyltransferase
MAAPHPIVRLKPRRALPFFSRHPWVFVGAISDIGGTPAAGDLVELRTQKGEFVAWGLFNPNSNIRVRLYSWDKSQLPDIELWRTRIDRAIALRQRLYGETDTWRACRLIYSEGDELSGLVVDRYGDTLLVQWTSLALWQQREEILEALRAAVQPRGIWLRTERGMAEAEGLEMHDALVWGEPPERPMVINEHGVQFEVDVVEGQKTGFYFDQRDNRLAVSRLTPGRSVLDVCSYTGGFGITAAAIGGATSVTAIDSSGPALELARRNAELNGVIDRFQTIHGDALETMLQLRDEGRRFGVVILDPPKMARTRGGLERALKGYLRLNRAAIELVEEDGILVTCSCSGLVDRYMFREVVAQAVLETGRTGQIMEERSQSADHPVSLACPETEYLKCLVLRVTRHEAHENGPEHQTMPGPVISQTNDNQL